jgi:serine/threonine protein kinase
MLGQKIGNYRLVRLIGTGGMGMVYESIHDGIGGRAAIKVLRPEIASNEDTTQRFFSEARAANLIAHPGIVHIFDCGYTSSGIAYLTMEFLEGETLKQRLDRQRVLSVSDALRLLRQVALALQSAHARSVIHRDLKPDNLMLIRDAELLGGERVKILDFGIAKISEGLAEQTRTGMLMGTPAYMAPEQCREAKLATDRSDVYSLGVILYQVLAGHPPFQGEYAGDVMAMQMMKEPPPLAQQCPWLHPDVVGFVHRLLAKQPTARPSMEEVGKELQRLSELITAGQTQAGTGATSEARLMPSQPLRVTEAIRVLEPSPAARKSTSHTIFSASLSDGNPVSVGAGVGQSSSTLTITTGQRQTPRRARILTSVVAGSVSLLASGLYFGLINTGREHAVDSPSKSPPLLHSTPAQTAQPAESAPAATSEEKAVSLNRLENVSGNARADEVQSDLATEKGTTHAVPSKSTSEVWREAFKSLQAGAYADAIRQGTDCEESGAKKHKCTWIVGMAACKELLTNQEPIQRALLTQYWKRSSERLRGQNQEALAHEIASCIPALPPVREPKPVPGPSPSSETLPGGLKVPRFEAAPPPPLRDIP